MVQIVHRLTYHRDQSSVQPFGTRKEVAGRKPHRFHIKDWTSLHNTFVPSRAFLVFLLFDELF